MSLFEMQPVFSEDVVECIVQFVEDIPDLKAISLVCKSWSTLAHRYMHQRRRLRASGNNSRWFGNFLHFKEVRPVYAGYIRILELTSLYTNWLPPMTIFTISAILSNLPRIHTFRISRISWEVDPDDSRIPTIPSLHNLYMEDLETHSAGGMSQPMQMLELSPGWENVEIRHMHDDWTADTPVLPGAFAIAVLMLPSIRNEHLGAPVRFLPAVTGLRHLEVESYALADYPAIRQIIHSNITTLKVLHIGVSPSERSDDSSHLPAAFIDLAVAVEQLVLVLPLFDACELTGDDKTFQPILCNRFLAEAVNYLPAGLSLLVVHFVDDLGDYDSHDATLEDRLRVNWRIIAGVVQEHPSLRCIKIVLRGWFTRSIYPEWTMRLARRIIPAFNQYAVHCYFKNCLTMYKTCDDAMLLDPEYDPMG